jgi:adenine-specific DNA-methyltransferase
MSAASLHLTAADLFVSQEYRRDAQATLHHGDCLELLGQLPDGEASLIVTSPPYNIGKEYEKRRSLQAYLRTQRETIAEVVRACADDGSICWQVRGTEAEA